MVRIAGLEFTRPGFDFQRPLDSKHDTFTGATALAPPRTCAACAFSLHMAMNAAISSVKMHHRPLP
jgi:hypothetical protein